MMEGNLLHKYGIKTNKSAAMSNNSGSED